MISDKGKGGKPYQLINEVLDFYSLIMTSSVKMESHDQKKVKEEEKKKQASPTKAKPMFLDLLVNDEEQKTDKEPTVKIDHTLEERKLVIYNIPCLTIMLMN